MTASTIVFLCLIARSAPAADAAAGDKKPPPTSVPHGFGNGARTGPFQSGARRGPLGVTGLIADKGSSVALVARALGSVGFISYFGG